MAEKGWTAQAAAAAGIAAGTGAAQLGLGYGLGVVVWPTATTTGDTVWLGSLGWATWIAAGSTVFGAIAGSRVNVDTRPRTGVIWRLTLAVAAAVGALLTVALIAVPARFAERADTFSPQTTAAGYAVAGILIGIVMAYWAVTSRPVAANLIVTAVWLWALAVAVIVHGLVTRATVSGIYLSGWQSGPAGAEFRFGAVHWPSALLMLGVALLLGALAVWPAVRRGDHGIGAAASGAVGPLLVALTFLILVPQVTTALGELESPYLVAPYAVLAGLAGSALVVALARQAAVRRSGHADPGAAPGGAPAAVPVRSAAPVAVPASAPARPARFRARSSVTASVPAPSAAPAPSPAPPSAAPAPAARPATDEGRAATDEGRPATDQGRADRGGFLGRLRPGRAHVPKARAAAAAPEAVPATGADRREPDEPRTSTVAPPPVTPAVAQINPPEARPAEQRPAAGTDTQEQAARPAARPARSAGRATDTPAPPARKGTRPRKTASGSADPGNDANPA